MANISVIIPVYNGEETVDACLSSVRDSVFQDFEIILVDDGSTDRTLEIAGSYNCQILHQDQNLGAAHARNMGAKIASGEILFFLDADIRVEKDTLSKIMQSFQNQPDISALFCSYQIDTPADSFYSKYKNLLHHYTHQTSNEDAATFCGGFGAIKKEVFQHFGGFRETCQYLEDIELGYRLHQSGYKILLNKNIQLTHLKQYSLFSLIKSDVLGRAKPWTEIMLEKKIVKNDLNTRVENAISLVVAFLLLAVLPVLFLKSFGWLLFCILAILFLLLNQGFFTLILKEKGFIFLVKSILLNWFGYIYSGFGLVLGLLAQISKCLRRFFQRSFGD